MKLVYLTVIALLISVGCATSNKKVEFRHNADDKKVDVYIGGNYFTSYMYPDDMEKQVLNPIFTASGKEIRGYPLNPRPFERTDHPHHIGFWLNFGAVNGLDFWNNSFAISPENKHKYGSIKFKEIVETNSQTGKLVAKSDWVDNDNNILLNETTTYVFGEDNGIRTIERITELTAAAVVTIDEFYA